MRKRDFEKIKIKFLFILKNRFSETLFLVCLMVSRPAFFGKIIYD